MMANQNTKRILIYIAFAFGIPWGAALVITLNGMLAENALQAVGLANTIFISSPWLANLAARLLTREGWGNLYLRPNFKRGWRYYLAAWFLPALATLVGGGLFYLLNPQSFDPNLGALRKLLESSPASAAAAASMDPLALFLPIALSTILITPLINGLASFGEEFGWRAYLLPNLVERAGTRRAAVLTGLIHGVWHWPLMLMGASLTPGFNYLTLLVYLAFTCSLSVLLSWAALRSHSVWPAALGHGAVNAVSALPGFLLLGQAIPLAGPDPSGLIGSIGYTLLALALILSPRAFSGAEAASPEWVKTLPAAK